jgi:hypothetical protein
VQIIGLNMSRYAGTAFTLAQMTNGRSMPWLRCEAEASLNDPSTHWAIPTPNGGSRQPLYRELVILNHRNEYLQSFALASQPIDGPTNAAQRATVRAALTAAAVLTDTDADNLPDAWEQDEFGGLATVDGNTLTPSGLTAFMAYAIGHSPHTQTPNPGIHITQTATSLTLHSTRRLAQLPGLVWQLHTSRQLAHWTEWTGPGQPVVRPLFDGSGTAQITYDLSPTPTPDALFRLMIKP